MNQCEMCNEVMTKCDFDYCDICPECLEGEQILCVEGAWVQCRNGERITDIARKWQIPRTPLNIYFIINQIKLILLGVYRNVCSLF